MRSVAVADGLAFTCLFALLLIRPFGMNGVWAAQILGCVSCVVMICAYAAVQNRKPFCSLREMLCFPDDFGVPEDQRLDISIHSMAEVINVSKQVTDFCAARGIGRRQGNCVALCVEELAGNIVRHGFSDGKKHCIDIRVSSVKGKLRLSLKDDCRPFNPEEAAKLFDPDDKTHNIGLRLAAGMSRSMSYQHILGLNVLLVMI